jgi:ankyrin repeat protein
VRLSWRIGNNERTFWTIPNPFLMKIKFNDITFSPSQESTMPNIAPDDSSLALVTAAFKGDLTAVRSLLDHGTNPNARDMYAHTALMHAAQMDRDEIIELLLDRGADISLTDDEGLTATDYLSYPPRSSEQNPSPFEKANDRWRDKHK